MQSTIIIKKVVVNSRARCVAPSIRTMSYQRNYRLVKPPLAIYKRNTALVCVNNATNVRHYASWDKKDPDQNESPMFKRGKEAAEAAMNVAQKSTEFMSEAAQKAYTAGTEAISNMVGSTKAKGAEANRAAEEVKHSAEETFTKGKHAAQEAMQQGKHAAQETAKNAEAHAKGASASAKDFVTSSKEYVNGAVEAAKDAINKRGDKD